MTRIGPVGPSLPRRLPRVAPPPESDEMGSGRISLPCETERHASTDDGPMGRGIRGGSAVLTDEEERETLLATLQHQRNHVLETLEGLTEHDLHRAVLPSGWRDVRGTLLHVITETAAHAGHLDVVRELFDGRLHLVLTDFS